MAKDIQMIALPPIVAAKNSGNCCICGAKNLPPSLVTRMRCCAESIHTLFVHTDCLQEYVWTWENNTCPNTACNAPLNKEEAQAINTPQSMDDGWGEISDEEVVQAEPAPARQQQALPPVPALPFQIYQYIFSFLKERKYAFLTRAHYNTSWYKAAHLAYRKLLANESPILYRAISQQACLHGYKLIECKAVNFRNQMMFVNQSIQMERWQNCGGLSVPGGWRMPSHFWRDNIINKLLSPKGIVAITNKSILTKDKLNSEVHTYGKIPRPLYDFNVKSFINYKISTLCLSEFQEPLLAVGGTQGEFTVLSTSYITSTFNCSEPSIYGECTYLLSLSHDEFAMAHSDGTIRIWDIHKGKVTKQIPGHGDPVVQMELSTEKHLGILSQGGLLRLWDIGEIVALPAEEAAPSLEEAFHPAVQARIKGPIHKSAVNGIPLHRGIVTPMNLSFNEDKVDRFAFIPGGIITASRFGTVCLWNETGTLLNTVLQLSLETVPSKSPLDFTLTRPIGIQWSTSGEHIVVEVTFAQGEVQTWWL